MRNKSIRLGSWALVGVILLSSTLAFAARPRRPARPGERKPLGSAEPTKFKEGDSVIDEWGNNKRRATVLEVDSFSGWVTARYVDKDREIFKRPGQYFKLLKKKTKVAAKEDNPFETTDERANKNGPRTWKDASGKHTIEGSLVRFENEKVTLKRTKDGKEITLSLAKLSDADRKFLTGDEPEERSSKSDDGETSDDAEVAEQDEEEPDEMKLTDVDASSARPVDVNPHASWTYKAQAAAAPVALGKARVSLGPKEFFEKPKGLLVQPDQATAVALYVLEKGGSSSTRVLKCDLKRQKVTSAGQFVAGQAPIDMTPDMSRVAATSVGFGFGKQSNLYLYDVEGEKVKPRVAWQPCGKDKDVVWARFIGKDHLLTCGNSRLVLWNVSDKVEPVYQVTVTGSAVPDLSADGKYLAVTTARGVAIVDAMAGETAGVLQAKDADGKVAFDREGKQIALVTWGRIRAWDLESRKMTRDFAYDGSGDSVEWADRDHLLCGEYLVDVPRRITVWKYTSLSPISSFAGGRLWYLAGSRGSHDDQLLASGNPVHDGVREVVQGINPESLLVIQPGMTVGLDVQMGPLSQNRDKVYQGLKSQLEASGLKVNDASELKLVATITPGESKTQQYRTFGGGFETTSVQVTEYKTEIAFRKGSDTLWSRKGMIHPSFSIRSQEGESIAQAISRGAQEQAGYLGGNWIPGFVAKLPAGKEIGSSETPPSS